MTAKEYMSQAYRIDQRINGKLEQVMSLRSLAEKASSTLSDIPNSGQRNIHRMEDVIGKIVDLEAEINADLHRLIDTKREIVAVVKNVDSPEHQTLLELRYLCFRTWEEISVELHYDIRHVYRLHGGALNEVDAIRYACH